MPLDDWQQALDRQPDDVKVVVEVAHLERPGAHPHPHGPTPPAPARPGPGRAGRGRRRWPPGIAPGVLEIDTLLGGWHRVTAGYLVEGPAPVLVETGSQSSVPVLLAALDALGLGPATWPGWWSPTSTSTTPAGWATWPGPSPGPPSTSTRRGPATWPTRPGWCDSAALVYGPLLDSLYGRLEAPRPSGCTCSRTARRSAVGPDRVLVAVDSPGHAKHHVGLHDSASGVLFAGDAVGVRLPDAGVLRPSTPPPDFDLDQALHSLAAVRRAPADGHRPGPLRAAGRSGGPAGGGRGDAPASGPRRPRGPSPRAGTSPPPWPSGSTR